MSPTTIISSPTMADAAPRHQPQPAAAAEHESADQPNTSDVNFSAALASWRDISLAELQKTLDAQGSLPLLFLPFLHGTTADRSNKGIEIVSNQKENLVGRKKLAEQTRGASVFALVLMVVIWC